LHPASRAQATMLSMSSARRTITKRALRAGEDPIKVQLMMGWASPAMVLRYADEVAQETASARLVKYAPI
jgi:integrase